ncbi:MAG TPA: histidine kinase [Casimicrobiaceae bacterium]
MRPAAVPLDSADTRAVVDAADTARALPWRRAFAGLSPTAIAIIFALMMFRAVGTMIDRLVQAKDVDAFIGMMLAMFEALVATGVMAATMIVIIVAALNLVPGRGPARIAALAAAVFVASGLGVFLRMACGDWFDAPNWQHIRAFVVYVWPRYFVIGSLLTIVAELYRRERASIALAEQAEVDSVALERDLAAARLQALQAQIEPHFLFNTLANVRRLYEEDGVAGGTMLEMLMRYIEVVLPGVRGGKPTLAREAALIEAYLHIQRVRMGARLAFTVEIPPRLRDAQVPPMMLLTLVENAVKHGLTPSPDGGRIRVTADADRDRLVLTVADTGVGFGSGSGSGIGLANISARLASQFGERAHLSLENNALGGATASIALPFSIAHPP